MNQFKPSNAKIHMANCQRITNNEEILKKIKGAKLCLGRTQGERKNQNPSLKQDKLKLLMRKSASFFKKN